MLQNFEIEMKFHTNVNRTKGLPHERENKNGRDKKEAIKVIKSEDINLFRNFRNCISICFLTTSDCLSLLQKRNFPIQYQINPVNSTLLTIT